MQNRGMTLTPLPSFPLVPSSSNEQSLYQGNQTQLHSPCLPTRSAILEKKKTSFNRMHCSTRKCNGFSEIQTMFIWDWLDRLSVYMGAFLNWSEWIQTDPKLDLQKTGPVAIWIHSNPVPEWSRVNTWTSSKALHVNRSQSGDCGE